MLKKGVVYLLSDSSEEKRYKIGVTRGNIYSRIKKLQTGNSNEITLIKLFETNYPFFIEKKLHLIFNDKKVLNEWFALTNSDVESFYDLCKREEEIVNIMKNNIYFKKHMK